MEYPIFPSLLKNILFSTSPDTEEIITAASLLTCIREGLGSNFGPDTNYPDGGFRGFPQSLKVNAGIVPRLGQDYFLSNPFQFIIIHHPVWSLY
jgi:hypothetical protein